ncbi:MAG: hypothetical protein LBJ63_11115 [Prevotellaceae bacterium]|jgi:hypothetical protein|nr:hypothetical protein [Prevotellaceae bacterium]
MKKTLVAIAVSVIALFAAQNANGQEMTQQTNENAFVLAQAENINDEGLDLERATPSILNSSTANSAASGCGMTYSCYKDGSHHYIKYNNPTKNYVLIYFKYTTDYGESSSYVEAKPEISSNVNVCINCISCNITGCKILD